METTEKTMESSSSFPRYVTLTLGMVVTLVGLPVLFVSKVPSIMMGKKSSSMMLQSKKGSEDFVLSSSVLSFREGSYKIPDEYTCWGGENGDNIPLQWSGAPDGTQSFMLILTTPQTGNNCPRFDWVVYDIDADTTSIEKGGSEIVGTLGRTWPGISNGADHSYYVKVPCPEVDDEDSEGETFTYTYTIYALNGKMMPIVEAMLEDKKTDDYYAELGPELLIESQYYDMIVGQSTLTATYTCESYDACPAGKSSAAIALAESSNSKKTSSKKSSKKAKKDGKGRKLLPITNADDGGECVYHHGSRRNKKN